MRHLEKHRRAHGLHAPAAAGQHARCVVAGKEIPHGILHFLRIEHHGAVHARVKLRQRPAALGKEFPNRLGENVVHRAVEHVAHGAPLARIVPALGDHDRIRFRLQHGAAELPPEIGIDLRRYVQPPAVHVRLAQPIAPHVEEIRRAGLVLHVQLGHVRPFFAEGHVAAGVLRPEEEPVVIFGRLALLHRVLKRREAQAAVVEHAVQHDADVPRVQRVGQIAQILQRAEQRVNLVIVERVVAVGGIRKENRRHIDHAHAQLGQIRHGLQNALEVAAEAIFVRHALAAPRLDGLLPRHIHAAEAIRKDLVADAPARPLRLLLRGIGVGIVETAHPRGVFRHGARAVRIVQQRHVPRAQNKRVDDARVARREHRLPDLAVFIPPHALHRRIGGVGKRFALGIVEGMAQRHRVKLICGGRQPDADAPVAERVAILQPRDMVNGGDLKALHGVLLSRFSASIADSM